MEGTGKQGKKRDMERSPKRITRQLRDRKERKVYTEFWALGDADDDIEGPQSFDLEEKLNSTKFNKNVVLDMRGADFNLSYIQRHGFTEPLIFHSREGLGIRIPTPTFNVGDVKTCVGSKRLLDVMDVRTQKNTEMSMKQWQEYYDKEDKDRLLNVISLEFSHTKLENFVEAPTVVRQLDWVDRVWPRHLKNMQTESTNVMDEMMYPKVQKYCLMSVKGCYTDFHVDFGGTSVWYHILKGAKVFWLIPPTDKNLELYQEWVLSGKQGDTFFGDHVDICSRVYLSNGDTFFIPSGWIHAVYTPKDSLVFGGNFLHSFGIEKQLKIATVEEQTKVPQKFRYPFFTEMLWYTLERYVHCLLGQSFIRIPFEDDDENQKDWKPIVGDKLVPDDVALSPQELLGLKAIVLYLHQLPIQRKNVPALIYDPVSLLKSIRQIVEMHRYDNPAKAVTGKPILVWPGERAEDVGKVAPMKRQRSFKAITASKVNNDSDWVDSPSSNPDDVSKRRVRCGKCQACRNTEDCNQCGNCAIRLKYKDSVEILRRKVCVMKECMAPVLIHNAACSECGMDGWNDTPSAYQKLHVAPSTLMECSLCWKMVHPICIGHKANPQIIAIVNDDLPNSWECPLCLDISRPRPMKKNRSLEDSSNKGSMDNNNSNSMNFHDFSSVSNNSAMINHEVIVNGNSNTSFPGTLKNNIIVNNNAHNSSFTGTAVVKEEKFEMRKSLLLEKSARDDKDSVKQKLDEVVRRKSTEEAAKLIYGKMNAAIKRTLSTGSEGSKPKLPRQLTEGTNGVVANNSNGNSIGYERTNRTLHEPHEKPFHKKIIKKEIESDESEDEKEKVDGQGVKKKSSPIKTELSAKIMGTSSKSLKKPTNVVRPASDVVEDSSKVVKKKLTYPALLKEKSIWSRVFTFLDIKSLNRVLQVSKDWNRIGVSPEVWEKIDLSHTLISADLLRGVVRRQPSTVTLNWTKISKQQLLWLISRLPQLKHLSLQGSSWNTVVALKTSFCPALEGLDLGHVDNLLDNAVREILAPPLDSRPGLTDSKSRLRHLKFLNLSGAHLSDVSLRYVTQHAGSISKLNLSCCPRITDAGIAQLGAFDSPSLENLTHLYITGCPQLTNISLEHLKRCKKLVYLDIENIPQITVVGLSKFLNQLAEAESAGTRTTKMKVKHSLPTSQLDIPNLHQNYYQSEMVSSSNSLTSPGPPPGISTLASSVHSVPNPSAFKHNGSASGGVTSKNSVAVNLLP